MATLSAVVSSVSSIDELFYLSNQDKDHHSRILQDVPQDAPLSQGVLPPMITEEEMAKATALRGYSITHHSTRFYLRLYGVPNFPASEHQLAIYVQALGYFLTLRFNKYMHKIDWKQTPKVHVDLVVVKKQTLKHLGSNDEFYEAIDEVSGDNGEEVEKENMENDEGERMLSSKDYGGDNDANNEENVLEIETHVDTRYEVPHDAPDPVLYFYLRMQSIIVDTFNNWEYGEKIFLQRLEEQCAKVDTRIPSAKGWEYFSGVRHLQAFTEYDLYQDVMKKQITQQRLANFRKFTFEVVTIIFTLFVLLVMSSVVIVLKRRLKRINDKTAEDSDEEDSIATSDAVKSEPPSKKDVRYNLSKIKQKRPWSIHLVLNFISEVYSQVLSQLKSIRCPEWLAAFRIENLPRVRIRRQRYNSKQKLEYIDEENESEVETDYESEDGYSSGYYTNEDEKLIDSK